MTQEEPAQPAMYCRQCGYALIGLSENRCPECGRPFDPADRRTFSRHPQSDVWRWWAKRVALAVGMMVLLAGVFVAACFGWVYWRYHGQWQAEQEVLARLKAAGGKPGLFHITTARIGSGPVYSLTAPLDRYRERVTGIIVRGLPPSRIDLADLRVFRHCDAILLGDMALTDDQVAPLAGLTGLKMLNLAENPALTDEGVSHLKGLTSLTRLDLSGTGVSGAGLAHLQGMTRLRHLSLANTRVRAGDLGQLKALPSLQVLVLADLPLADEDLPNLGPLALSSLDLERTKITDAGLAEVGKMSTLQDLHLTDTAITDAGLRHLSGLSALRMLYLCGTAVTDGGLKHLAGLSNLKRLDVRFTKVTPEGTRQLKQSVPSLWTDDP